MLNTDSSIGFGSSTGAWVPSYRCSSIRLLFTTHSWSADKLTLEEHFAVVVDVGGDFRFVGEELLGLLVDHFAQLSLTQRLGTFQSVYDVQIGFARAGISPCQLA